MNLLLLKISRTVETPPPAPRSFMEHRVDEIRYLSNSLYYAFKGAATRLVAVPRYLPTRTWVVIALLGGFIGLLLV
jgi:hypothetical protein